MTPRSVKERSYTIRNNVRISGEDIERDTTLYTRSIGNSWLTYEAAAMRNKRG